MPQKAEQEKPLQRFRLQIRDCLPDTALYWPPCKAQVFALERDIYQIIKTLV